MIKAHVGCGDVYLQGYSNCDISGKNVKALESNPNETTLNKYFKYPFETPRRDSIVDLNMNALEQWPFAPGSVSELVTISFIEHFPPQNVDFVLTQVERCLAPDRSGAVSSLSLPGPGTPLVSGNRASGRYHRL